MSSPVLETERLILRKFALTDAESMWVLNKDSEVLRYTGDVPFSSIQNAHSFLKNYTAYTLTGHGRWAVINKTSNEFIGWCGLKLNEENLVDIGFRFFRKEWNKGYATEAAKACLTYGFEVLKMKQIIARANTQNLASIRVLEKIGMDYWKTDFCEGLGKTVYYRVKPI